MASIFDSFIDKNNPLKLGPLKKWLKPGLGQRKALSESKAFCDT